MAQTLAVESDPTRRQRRPWLNRVDRLLVAAAAVFVVLLGAGIASLYIPPAAVPIDSYGYDLSNLSVDRDLVVSGMRRDGVTVLDAPEVIAAAASDLLSETEPGKFLVGGDRVIGVVLNGEARAYPLRILNWHEIVNDVVGGVPIAVTYSPLCDSAVVFDRRAEGEVLDFGCSGLLYNANLLMYDRREREGDSSLWSQLAFVAVTGPRAGQGLAVLPMAVARWDRWRKDNPRTTVLRGLPAYRKQYQRNPYGHYYNAGKLKFPVRPLPPAGAGSDGPTLMTPIVALRQGTRWQALPLHAGAVEHAASYDLQIDTAGEAATFTFGDRAPVPSVYACWFAWYAMHGGGESAVTGAGASSGDSAAARQRTVLSGTTLVRAMLPPTIRRRSSQVDRGTR